MGAGGGGVPLVQGGNYQEKGPKIRSDDDDHTSSHWRLHEVTVKGHTVSGNTTRPALETWGIQQLDWAQRLRGGGVGGYLWFKEVTTRKRARRLEAMIMMKIIIMTVAMSSMLVMMM